jgi:hypothetical protein
VRPKRSSDEVRDLGRAADIGEHDQGFGTARPRFCGDGLELGTVAVPVQHDIGSECREVECDRPADVTSGSGDDRGRPCSESWLMVSLRRALASAALIAA